VFCEVIMKPPRTRLLEVAASAVLPGLGIRKGRRSFLEKRTKKLLSVKRIHDSAG
jgi:hypothetical protein